MDIGSIIIVIIMAVGFAFAALFIAKNGGWQGEQCQGHCASCNHKCADALEERKANAADGNASNASNEATAIDIVATDDIDNTPN